MISSFATAYGISEEDVRLALNHLGDRVPAWYFEAARRDGELNGLAEALFDDVLEHDDVARAALHGSDVLGDQHRYALAEIERQILVDIDLAGVQRRERERQS